MFNLLVSLHFLSVLECSRSLGMETGDIKDSDISASSYFDYHSVGPHNARYYN